MAQEAPSKSNSIVQDSTDLITNNNESKNEKMFEVSVWEVKLTIFLVHFYCCVYCLSFKNSFFVFANGLI